MDVLGQLATDGERSLLEICLCVLNVGDKALMTKFQDILSDMNDHKYLKWLKDCINSSDYEKIHSKKIPKSLYYSEIKSAYRFLYTWSQQLQEIIIWIIQMPKDNGYKYLHRASQWVQKDKLTDRYSSMQTWLDDIQYLLSLYTMHSSTVKNFSEEVK